MGTKVRQTDKLTSLIKFYKFATRNKIMTDEYILGGCINFE
jgi:hypothetical protein